MTVRKLIEYLQEQDPDLPVCIINKEEPHSKPYHRTKNQEGVLNNQEAWEIEIVLHTSDNYLTEEGEDANGEIILIYG